MKKLSIPSIISLSLYHLFNSTKNALADVFPAGGGSYSPPKPIQTPPSQPYIPTANSSKSFLELIPTEDIIFGIVVIICVIIAFIYLSSVNNKK